MSEELRITSVDEMREYGGLTRIVKMPPFANGAPLVAKIKPPSVLRLASEGKFPNELLNKAAEMFIDGKNLDTEDPALLSGVFGVLEIMARATLVSPTYEEIREAGLELSDTQLMFLWNCSQSGVAALEPFRDVKEDRKYIDDVKTLQMSPQ